MSITKRIVLSVAGAMLLLAALVSAIVVYSLGQNQDSIVEMQRTELIGMSQLRLTEQTQIAASF